MDLELYIDRIEQYETGVLPAADRAAFESELGHNAELREALALFRQANEVVEQGIENSLREELQSWNVAAERPMTVTRSNLRSTWLRLAAAASIALLMGWFGYHWAHSQYSDQAIFAGQYEKPTDSTIRGHGAERPLQPGFDALAEGNLPLASAFFSSIPTGDEYYAEAQYYLGHTALQQRQYAAAITAFGHTADRPASKFREKAAWNRVLAYLAAGRTEEPVFQTYLGQIAADPAHSYQAQAQDLQKKLHSFWR
ncbi:MAG: hypothetical protein ABIQ93_03090 [Saprospiraceae bacterium]